MENQTAKKQKIKLTFDEAYLLSGRIMKDTFNCTDLSFFVTKLEDDDINVLQLDVLRLSQFIDALDLLKPAYLKKIRTWLRVKRSRSNPNVESRADILTTMNISKRNLWDLDACVTNYNHNHQGADIKRDDMLSLLISTYKLSNGI